jgi:hypothetical protein
MHCGHLDTKIMKIGCIINMLLRNKDSTPKIKSNNLANCDNGQQETDWTNSLSQLAKSVTFDIWGTVFITQ